MQETPNITSLTFVEYTKLAAQTAQYPKFMDGIPVYPALGLAGEAGEVLFAVLSEDKQSIKEELGDHLWYISRCFVDVGLALPEIDLATVRPTTNMSMGSTGATALLGGSCKAAEAVKKWTRTGTRTEEDLESYRKLLLQLLGLVASLADHYKMPLVEIAKDNLEKLRGRYAN